MADATGLLIPYAVGPLARLVAAWDGEAGGQYACPGCAGPVVWRRAVPDVRRAHFAHRADASCSGESATHGAAKRLVAQQVQDWVAGLRRRPVLAARCTGCAEWGKREPVAMPRAQSADIERRAAGGFVADVLLALSEGKAAIELVVTHAMGAEKVAAYNAGLAWWVELDAAAVLDDPGEWRVLAWGGEIHGRDWKCAECAEARRQKALDTLAEAREQTETASERMAAAEAMAEAAEKAKTQAASLGAYVKDRLDAVERASAELAHVRSQVNASEVEKLRLRRELESMRADVDAEDVRIKAARVVDLRKLEETYRLVFDATERLRLRQLSLTREVDRLERRLGLQGTRPSTASTSNANPDAP